MVALPAITVFTGIVTAHRFGLGGSFTALAIALSALVFAMLGRVKRIKNYLFPFSLFAFSLSLCFIFDIVSAMLGAGIGIVFCLLVLAVCVWVSFSGRGAFYTASYMFFVLASVLLLCSVFSLFRGDFPAFYEEPEPRGALFGVLMSTMSSLCGTTLKKTAVGSVLGVACAAILLQFGGEVLANFCYVWAVMGQGAFFWGSGNMSLFSGSTNRV